MNNRYEMPQAIPVRNDQIPNYYGQNGYVNNYPENNDERLAGGLASPFLLGGVTGAALAPAFWRPGYGYNNRPPAYYPPYPQYGPYPPRRWF